MKTHVLALFKKSTLSEMIESHFQEIIGFRPIFKETIEDVQHFLELLNNIEVLVIDGLSFEKEVNSLLLFVYLKQINIEHIVVLGNVQTTFTHPNLYMCDDPENILDKLKAIFKMNPDDLQSYISIPINSLIHFKYLPFDLFIKLAEGNYVKVFKACEAMDKTTVKSFKDRGVKEFFFDRSHNREFSMILLNNMMNGIERDYVTLGEKIEAKNDVFLTTKEIVQSLGFPSRIVKLCESVMTSIIEDVQLGKDQFSQYLEQLKKPEYCFQFRYIELSCYFATRIIEEIEVFASCNYSRLIVFSAFFCDVSLKDPKYLHVLSSAQLKAMPEDKAREISFHALRSSEMVLGYQNAPQGAEKIIRQHHGTLNGVGFSDQNYNTIGPLSKCLIASQTLAYEILTNPETPVQETVEKVMARFKGTTLEEMVARFSNKNVSLKAG